MPGVVDIEVHPGHVIDFGGDERLVTLAVRFEGAADDAFAFALGVDITGVQQVDARVERSVDHAEAFRLRRRIGEVVRAEAKRRHVDTGTAELAKLQPSTPRPPTSRR